MTQRRPKKSKGPSKSSAAAASLQARSSGSTTGTTAFQAFQQFSQAPPSATPYPDHGSGSSGNGNGNGNGSGSTYTRYEEDTAASLPPRVHIMLKHLGKKDAVTKIKALKDLQNVVTEDTNTVSGVVHSLQRIVERLSRDSDYRVREHLFHLIAAIAQSQRRALAPVLRSIAGPWLTSRHDPHPAVARAAQEAFDAAFAEDKRTAAWKHCASDVFRYANKMVSLSPEDMRDKGMDIQDAQDRFDRVVSSCIRSTAAAIANGTSPSSREQDPVAVLFDTVLSFLTDASSPLPYSRAAAFLFITSIAQHRSPLISPHASTIASTLVSHLSAPDAQVQHAVWGQALLTVLHHHRDTILPAMNPDTVVSGLETVLRSHPGRPVLQGLVPFLSVLPPVSTFFANVFRMYHAVFGSLLAAMESDALPSHLLPDAVQTYLEAIMVLALRDDGNHAQTHTTTNIDTETNTTAYTESEPSQPKQPSQKSASLSPHIKPLLTVHLPALLSLLLSSPHLSFQHEQMFAQRVAPTLQKLSERSITSSGIDTVIRGLGDLYRRYPPPKHRSRLLPRRDMAPRVAAAIRGLVPVLKAERMLGLVRPATCRAIRHASRETDEGTTDSDAAEVDVIAAGVMSCGADILINNNNNNNDNDNDNSSNNNNSNDNNGPQSSEPSSSPSEEHLGFQNYPEAGDALVSMYRRHGDVPGMWTVLQTCGAVGMVSAHRIVTCWTDSWDATPRHLPGMTPALRCFTRQQEEPLSEPSKDARDESIAATPVFLQPILYTLQHTPSPYHALPSAALDTLYNALRHGVDTNTTNTTNSGGDDGSDSKTIDLHHHTVLLIQAVCRRAVSQTHLYARPSVWGWDVSTADTAEEDAAEDALQLMAAVCQVLEERGIRPDAISDDGREPGVGEHISEAVAAVCARCDCMEVFSRTARKWIEHYPEPAIQVWQHGLLILTSLPPSSSTTNNAHVTPTVDNAVPPPVISPSVIASLADSLGLYSRLLIDDRLWCPLLPVVESAVVAVDTGSTFSGIVFDGHLPGTVAAVLEYAAYHGWAWITRDVPRYTRMASWAVAAALVAVHRDHDHDPHFIFNSGPHHHHDSNESSSSSAVQAMNPDEQEESVSRARSFLSYAATQPGVIPDAAAFLQHDPESAFRRAVFREAVRHAIDYGAEWSAVWPSPSSAPPPYVIYTLLQPGTAAVPWSWAAHRWSEVGTMTDPDNAGDGQQEQQQQQQRRRRHRLAVATLYGVAAEQEGREEEVHAAKEGIREVLEELLDAKDGYGILEGVKVWSRLCSPPTLDTVIQRCTNHLSVPRIPAAVIDFLQGMVPLYSTTTTSTTAAGIVKEIQSCGWWIAEALSMKADYYRRWTLPAGMALVKAWEQIRMYSELSAAVTISTTELISMLTPLVMCPASSVSAPAALFLQRWITQYPPSDVDSNGSSNGSNGDGNGNGDRNVKEDSRVETVEHVKQQSQQQSQLSSSQVYQPRRTPPLGVSHALIYAAEHRATLPGRELRVRGADVRRVKKKDRERGMGAGLGAIRVWQVLSTVGRCHPHREKVRRYIADHMLYRSALDAAFTLILALDPDNHYLPRPPGDASSSSATRIPIVDHNAVGMENNPAPMHSVDIDHPSGLPQHERISRTLDECWRLVWEVARASASYARTWFVSVEEGPMRQAVAARVGEHVTPILLGREMEEIQRHAAELPEHVRVRVSRRQVTAIYEQDDVSLEVVLMLPDAYPLQKMEVRTSRRLGVSEAVWRRWMVKMTSMMFESGASLWDSVQLWFDNLKQHFAGVEECPICYSIVHPSDGGLPRIPCPKCRHRFHAACLYRWFSTSHNNSCPLCRAIF